MHPLSSVSDSTQFPANILCIDQFSALGGGQGSLLDLLPAFSQRGWRPSVAIPGDGPFTERVRKLGYRTHIFTYSSYGSKKKPLVQHVKYALEMPHLVNLIMELVESNQIDLLYVNGARLVPHAAWVAWRTGIPLVFHCHNRLLQHSAITLTGIALELASAHMIACCQHAADPLREYVPPQRLRVIHNGVAEMATGKLRHSDRMRNIGVVGRVEADKGQLEFVKAAKLVLDQAPECRFRVIGQPMFSGVGYYGKVVAASLGLPIEFIDWQSDMTKVYSDLDMLVVPSTAVEATTRVILEAYSAGVPVVAFPTGGIPEILQDGQTGFLTETRTVEALAKRILSVLRMERPIVAALIGKARTEWSHRFTLQTYRDAVCGVLAQAIAPRLESTYAEICRSVDALTD
jgi:glycosyltransferase involved in cell wall biosynthesis